MREQAIADLFLIALLCALSFAVFGCSGEKKPAEADSFSVQGESITVEAQRKK